MQKMPFGVPITTHLYKTPFYPKTLEFRQCTNADTVSILQASEDTQEAKLHAIMRFVQNCLVSKVEVEQLPIFIVEMLLLRIFAESNNAVRDLEGACVACKSPLKFSIDLDQVQLKGEAVDTCTIPLWADIGVLMKYPSIQDVLDNPKDANLMTMCIEAMYNESDVFPAKDYDIAEFLGTMTPKQTGTILEFINKIPCIHLHKQVECPSCKHNNEYHFNKSTDFF